MVVAAPESPACTPRDLALWATTDAEADSAEETPRAANACDASDAVVPRMHARPRERDGPASMTADAERLEDLALDLVAEAASDRDDGRLA